MEQMVYNERLVYRGLISEWASGVLQYFMLCYGERLCWSNYRKWKLSITFSIRSAERLYVIQGFLQYVNHIVQINMPRGATGHLGVDVTVYVFANPGNNILWLRGKLINSKICVVRALDVFQICALRICLGATKTAPVWSHQVEAGEEPHSRKQLNNSLLDKPEGTHKSLYLRASWRPAERGVRPPKKGPGGEIWILSNSVGACKTGLEAADGLYS